MSQTALHKADEASAGCPCMSALACCSSRVSPSAVVVGVGGTITLLMVALFVFQVFLFRHDVLENTWSWDTPGYVELPTKSASALKLASVVGWAWWLAVEAAVLCSTSKR